MKEKTWKKERGKKKATDGENVKRERELDEERKFG